MNKTQTKTFALKVQNLITEKVTWLTDASEQDQLAFFDLIENWGAKLHPDAKYLIQEGIDLDAHESIVFGVKPNQHWKTTKQNLSFEDDNEIIRSFFWATDFGFCRNWSVKNGCLIVELFEYFSSFIRSRKKGIRHYEIQRLFYSYYINQVISNYPKLIIRTEKTVIQRSL